MKSDSEIIMFVMATCGFCKKAENILKDAIEEGIVEVKPHTECKHDWCRGFPAFVRKKDGKGTLGCPSSLEHLHEKFDKSEYKLSKADMLKLNKILPKSNLKSRKSIKPKGKQVVIKEPAKEMADAIIFYFMEGCGFCAAAKNMLAKQIENGTIVIKPHTEAPSNISAFPGFVYKDKVDIGLPKDFPALASSLGYKIENFIIRQEEETQPQIQVPDKQEKTPIQKQEDREFYVSKTKSPPQPSTAPHPAPTKPPQKLQSTRSFKNYKKPDPMYTKRGPVPSQFIGVL
jgi:glutaredoxin